MKAFQRILIFIIFLLIPSLTSADDEQIFQEARQYTVEINTAIRIPFYEDKKGSFSGTGFLVDKERGWILTNAHVASHSHSISQVAFYSHDFQPAEKVYIDPYLDLAILKVPPLSIPKEAKVPLLECIESPSVGHPVGAFGHPWGYSFTGTRGIISGITSKGGNEQLQTDAPINKGNSGGPLISLKTGRIVGINTEIMDSDKDQDTNFAEQMIFACRVLQLLRKNENPSPPKLKLIFQEDLETRGQLIVAKTYLSKNQLPLKEGDLILEVIGFPKKIKNEGQLVHALRGHSDDIALKIKRGKSNLTVTGSLELENYIRDRKGIFFSGILIAPFSYVDMAEIDLPPLSIHYVEEGSLAEVKGMDSSHFLYSVDGGKFRTIEKLYDHLMTSQNKNKKVTFKLQSFASQEVRLFQYLEVQLDIRNLTILK